MKKLRLIIYLLVTGCIVQATNIQVSVKPIPVITGEPAQLVITAASNAYPELCNGFPKVKNMQWMNTGISKMMQQINSSVFSSVSYWFVVNKAGTYTIPPFKVSNNGVKTMTTPLRFKAIAAGTVKATTANGDKQPLKNMLFAKAVILAEDRDFYVGQEIPIEIRLYLMRGLNASPVAWPQFNVDNIIFRNYPTNKQDKRFARPTQSTENINGRIFTVLKFTTAFRPIIAGKLNIAVQIPCEIKVPSPHRHRSRSWFDDDFFDGFGRSNYRRFKRTASATFPEININPLPAAPKDAMSLGLVGNWYVDFSIIGDELKVGEPFTLKMEIKGMGTLETLTAPRLKIPGFRIYRPEVDKGLITAGGSSKAVIKYVIIPTEKGEKKLHLTFSVFSCPKGKYQTFPYNKSLKIAKSDNPSVTNGGVYIDSGAQNNRPNNSVAKKPRPAIGLHYQKRNLSGTVEFPLYLNYLWLYLVLGLGGPLLLFAIEMRQRHRQKLNDNPLLQRKLKAQSKRGKVIKAIKTATDDDLDNTINQTVVPYLNALLGLPPGTTTSELANKVDSVELAKCLQSTGHSNYMPGSNALDKADMRKTLLKLLRKMSIFVLLCTFALNSFAGESKKLKPAQTSLAATGIINNSSQALTAYDNGEFRRAAEYYYNRLEKQQEADPALLYNLGNCFSRLGDYSRATVCYKRALLLAPADSDILENLNYVRRKLFLPQLGNPSNPTELVLNLRNQLRPDQWLAVAAVIWFMIFATIAFKRHYSRAKFITLLLSGSFALLLTLAAASSQYRSSYSKNRAIIITKMAKLYSLPSLKNAREISRVSSGTPVTILEKRINWIYIRHDNCEGWVTAGSLGTTAPSTKLFKLPWKQ